MAYSQEQLLTQFIITHEDFYNYSLVKYTTLDKPIDIICPIHGVFEQVALKHKKGKGCRKCGNITRAKNKSQAIKQTIIHDFNIKHNYKYDYSLVDYKDIKTKVKIICPFHGIFEQRPNAHKSGHGCSDCKTGWNNRTTYKDRKTTLYYIKVNDIYKIGLTMKTVKKRYSQDKEVDVSIIKEWVFEDGAIAYDLEQQIINTNIDYKYNGDPILIGGNSELFEIDIYDKIIHLKTTHLTKST